MTDWWGNKLKPNALSLISKSLFLPFSPSAATLRFSSHSRRHHRFLVLASLYYFSHVLLIWSNLRGRFRDHKKFRMLFGLLSKQFQGSITKLKLNLCIAYDWNASYQCECFLLSGFTCVDNGRIWEVWLSFGPGEHRVIVAPHTVLFDNISIKSLTTN